MIPVRGFEGAKVLVLGLGRSGLAAARALRAGGAEALCWDDGDAGRARAEDEGFALRDPLKSGAFEDVACLVTSPGIPHLYPTPHRAIAAAYGAGVPVDNDVGLFFRSLGTPEWDQMESPPKVVTVTGSNGKSTTSALIAHILGASGMSCQLAGNIGRGVLDIDPPEDGGVVVLELSSYQTELARALTPDVAVFTNLSPDHLDRHGGMGGYFAAKRRLFAEGGPERAIIGVDEPEGAYLAGQLSEGPSDPRVIRVRSGKVGDVPGWELSTRKGWLSEVRKGRQVASIDLRGVPGLPGAHNHQNAACAYGVARTLGLAPKIVEEIFATIRRLNEEDGVSILLVEQNAGVAFSVADYGYIMESGQIVMEGDVATLKSDKDIQSFYLGVAEEGGARQSYRDVKHYKRRKRWLS